MFFGREEQLNQLADLLKRRVASLVTCRGRRRIGKSTLIEEFARRNSVRLLKLEGLPPREAMQSSWPHSRGSCPSRRRRWASLSYGELVRGVCPP